MPLPIAELYAQPRSPLLDKPPRQLPAPLDVRPHSTASSSNYRPPGSGRVSYSTYRTSVSFKPTDDPFAARTPTKESQADPSEQPNDAWDRRRFHATYDSRQDSLASGAENAGGPIGSQTVAGKPRRRSSFLRSIFGNFTTRPRRTRSAAQLSISAPLKHDPPPPIAPPRSVASLIPGGRPGSAASAGVVRPTTPSYPSGSKTMRELSTSSIYPSGSNSLRQAGISKRASIGNLFGRASVSSGSPAAGRIPETIDEAAVGLALTTDGATASEPPRRADEQRNRLSASASSPQLRNPSEDARVPAIAYTAPTPGTTPATRRSGVRRASSLAGLTVLDGEHPPPPSRAETPSLAPEPARTESRASVRSYKSYGPPPPRPPRSLKRPPSRKRLAPEPIAGETSRPALASAYVVVGLAKDPRMWRQVPSRDCLPGDSAERRWYAEVLDQMVGGEEARDAADGAGGLSVSETDAIQARVSKLAFPHDVELVFAPKQPPATTACFHFSTSSIASQRYHAVALVIWSRADADREAEIRAVLRSSGDLSSEAVRHGDEAVRRSRRLSSRLAARAPGDAESPPRPTSSLGVDDVWDDRVERDPLGEETAIWLPYGMVLISRYSVYDLLSDLLRLSWAQHHRDLASHSWTVRRLLSHPMPRPGDILKVPASLLDEHTCFTIVMPGRLDWDVGVSLKRNFPLWPVLETLNSENLLTVAELAAAPLGKVAFLSRNPSILGLSVMFFEAVLEICNWGGLVLPAAHVRDVEIYLDDPGSWLLSVPFSARSLLASIPPEVAVVDLDNDLVSCPRPPADLLTKSALRASAVRRLEEAIGPMKKSPPSRINEAYADGRFRPFSSTEVHGVEQKTDRIGPAWSVDEMNVVRALAEAVAASSQAGLVRKVFRRSASRKYDPDPATLKAQLVVRRQFDRFTSRQQSLEAEVGAANRKLAALVSQSSEWQASFEQFRQYTNEVSHEADELQSRLDQAVLAGESRHRSLEQQLEDAGRARAEAQAELASLRGGLSRQRDDLLREVRSIADSIGDVSGRGPETSLPGLSGAADRIPPRPRLRALPASIPEEKEDVPIDAASLEESEEPSEAVCETFRDRLVRLARVLELEDDAHGADLLESTPSARSDSGSDSTLVSAAHEVVSQTSPPHGIRTVFHPKPLTLTPPVSPEEKPPGTSFSQVTIRASRRYRSAHVRGDSYASTGGDSVASSPSRGFASSRHLPQTSYASSTAVSEDADYLSASEGWPPSRAVSRANGTLATAVEELSLEAPDTPEPGRLFRRRQDSFSIDSPPVALFTRSNSVRSTASTCESRGWGGPST